MSVAHHLCRWTVKSSHGTTPCSSAEPAGVSTGQSELPEPWIKLISCQLVEVTKSRMNGFTDQVIRGTISTCCSQFYRPLNLAVCSCCEVSVGVERHTRTASLKRHLHASKKKDVRGSSSRCYPNICSYRGND